MAGLSHLGSREAEESLLQYGIPGVPERHGQTKAALAVTHSCQSVLAPAIGARPGVVMREVRPATGEEVWGVNVSCIEIFEGIMKGKTNTQTNKNNNSTTYLKKTERVVTVKRAQQRQKLH